MTACFLYESTPYQARQKGQNSPSEQERDHGKKHIRPPLTFNGRIVLLDEMALDEPDRQCGLAHSCPREREREREPVRTLPRENTYRNRETLTTTADENELVFA